VIGRRTGSGSGGGGEGVGSGGGDSFVDLVFTQCRKEF
jgi:hypothetical protein